MGDTFARGGSFHTFRLIRPDQSEYANRKGDHITCISGINFWMTVFVIYTHKIHLSNQISILQHLCFHIWCSGRSVLRPMGRRWNIFNECWQLHRNVPLKTFDFRHSAAAHCYLSRANVCAAAHRLGSTGLWSIYSLWLYPRRQPIQLQWASWAYIASR